MTEPANTSQACVTVSPRTSQVESEYASLEKAVAILNEVSHVHVDRIQNILRINPPDKEAGQVSPEPILVPVAEAIRKVRLQIERVNSLIMDATSRVEL